MQDFTFSSITNNMLKTGSDQEGSGRGAIMRGKSNFRKTGSSGDFLGRNFVEMISGFF